MMVTAEDASETADLDGALTIGELARTVGVSPRTIRYYEELGILPPPPRTPLGTRLYPPPWRFYLEGALALKNLGFSLREIALVGRFALGIDLSAKDRKQAMTIVEDHMKDLEHRIRVLKAIYRRFTEGVKSGGKLEGMMDEIGRSASRPERQLREIR